MGTRKSILLTTQSFLPAHSTEASQAKLKRYLESDEVNIVESSSPRYGNSAELTTAKNNPQKHTWFPRKLWFFSAQGQLKFQVFPFSPVQWTLCLGAIFCVNWCTPRTQGPSHENTGLINLKEEKRTIYHGKYFLRRWANICFKIIRGIFFLFFGLFGFFVPRHWLLQEVQIAHHVRDMHKLVGTLMPGGKQTTARGLERERERKLHKDKHVSPSVA